MHALADSFLCEDGACSKNGSNDRLFLVVAARFQIALAYIDSLFSFGMAVSHYECGYFGVRTVNCLTLAAWKAI